MIGFSKKNERKREGGFDGHPLSFLCAPDGDRTIYDYQ